MGKCTNVISIGVARKSEGTIVLKEIFGMVHRFVREMTIVYEISKLG